MKMVDIRPVKGLAARLLGSDSVLRRVLLAEPDSMPATEFVTKLGIYLFLLSEETSR